MINPAYRPIYVISDSEMEEFKERKIKMNLKKFVIKFQRLEESLQMAQVKHLDEREKDLKTELKSIEPAKKKF